MAKQGNKWLTNSYSDFVPTKVGDVLKEKTTAYAVQADRYNRAKENFQTKREAIEAIKVAPGNREFYDESVGKYNRQYKEAEEQGDFENMVYDAGDIASQLSSDYQYKKLQEDHTMYVAENTALEESDVPEKNKAYTRAIHAVDNQEGKKDSDGNLVYNKYVPMKEIPYTDTTANLAEYIGKLEKDGYYVLDKETGKMLVTKDIPGRLGIKKGTYLDPNKIKAVALDYMETSTGDSESINGEAEIEIGSYFLNSTEEDPANVVGVMKLINQHNPFEEGSEKYMEFIYSKTNFILDKVDKRRKEAEAKSEPFDEGLALKQVSTGLMSSLMRNTYANNASLAFSSYDEDITSWEADNLTDSTNGGTGYIPGVAEALFSSRGEVTSDSQTLKIAKEKSEQAIVTNKQELADLNSLKQEYAEENNTYSSENKNLPVSEQNKNLPVPEHKIEALNKQIEAKGKEVEYAEKQQGYLEESVYDTLRDEGLIPDIDIEELAKKRLKIPRRVAGEGSNYNPTEKEVKNEITFINKRLIEELIDPSTIPSGGSLMRGIEEHREQLEEKIFHRVFKSFNLEYKINSSKEITPYKEFISTEQVGKDIVFESPDQLNAIIGKESVTTFLDKAMSAGVKREDIKFKFSDTPDFEGNLVGILSYNESTKDGKKIRNPKGKIAFTFPKGNDNTQTIHKLLGQSMKNMTNMLLPNYDRLPDDKRELVKSAINITNIVDGTTESFSKLRLRSLNEGEKSSLTLGNDKYDFLAYNLVGQKNNYIVSKYGEGLTSSSEQKGTTKGFGKIAYGYHDNDYKDGKLIKIDGVEVSPQWYIVKEDGYKIDKKTGDVSFGFFNPIEYASPGAMLQAVTLQRAKEDGSFNKNISNSEKLHKDPITYRKNNTGLDNGITAKTTTLQKANPTWTIANGYYPMENIFGQGNVSANVQTPFLNINETGQNLLSYVLSQTLEATGKNVIASSGNRTEKHNAEVGGEDDSYHLSGQAFDVLYDGAGKYFIEQLKKYVGKGEGKGILSILPSEDGFYHVSFGDTLRQNNRQ